MSVSQQDYLVGESGSPQIYGLDLSKITWQMQNLTNTLKFGGTVEPVFSSPGDERPPAMYGQCFNVPITFQWKYPWDERPPGGRGQRFFVIFHLLGWIVNFILINIFKDGGDHFLFSTMDAGNGESARDLDPQLVTHFNLQPLAIDLSIVILFFSKFLVMSSDTRKIGLLSLC